MVLLLNHVLFTEPALAGGGTVLAACPALKGTA